MKRTKHENFSIQLNETSGPPRGYDNNFDSKYKMSEGVQLSDAEKKYLLPHFTMLVVGKPGSGKTSTVQQLLNDKDFYRHKFDTVLALSPSVTKMGLMLKKSNVT